MGDYAEELDGIPGSSTQSVGWLIEQVVWWLVSLLQQLGGLDAVRESAMALAEGKFWRWVDGGGEVLMLEKGCV